LENNKMKFFQEIKNKTNEAGGYYNPLDQERREQAAMDWQKRDFKRQEMQHELGHEDHPDFERNLRQQQMNRDRGPWYIRIEDVIYKQKGEPKAFDWKKGANNYALAMIKNRPELQGKIMLSKNSQDSAKEAVTENEDSPALGAIIHRIMVAHPDLLQKYGPERVMDAAREEAEFVGDVDEIGSSDVSAWVNNVKRTLEHEIGQVANEAEGDAEGLPHITPALLKDILDQVKTEGPHAIAKSVEWGDGAAQELTDFIVKKLKELEHKEEVTEAANPEDVICVDIPLFIRLMEYAREDAKTDMDLHRLTEKLTAMCAGGKTLSMADYDKATGTDEHHIRDGKPEVTEDENMPTGNLGYDNMSAILRAVDAGQDATIHLGGEPVTLEYPEARFIGGKYKAFLKAGRQEEFLKYMSNPVAFDRLMVQLRGMLDKIKNFKGSVPGERGIPGETNKPYESTGYEKLISRNGEDMDESAPPNFPQDLEKKLKAEYKDNPEKAYATMWSIHNKQKEKKESIEALPTTSVNEYWCQIDKQAKPIPEGYKKLASGYITRK
jgi:hypothetical protein